MSNSDLRGVFAMVRVPGQRWIGSLCVLGLALAACGGGGGGTGPGAVQSVILAGDPQYEARVSATYGAGGPTSRGFVGDDDDDDFIRAFYSFDLDPIPAGSEVTTAILFLYELFTAGTPYVDLGAIEVSHMDLGDETDTSDFSAAGLTDDLGDLATFAATGYRQIDVTDAVQDDLDMLRGRSQFRLRTETFSDLDGSNDSVLFELSTGDPGDPNVPRLQVTYRLP